MSTRWAYTNRNGMGSISTIYCASMPTDENPSGDWFIVRRMGPNLLLKNASEHSFFYYEDKNAYKTAKQNAEEVARKYIKAREECCCVM